MTILTAGTCAAVINSAGHTIPAAVGAATGTIITGAKLWLKAESVSTALSTAIGTGSSSGAIAGAIVSKTAVDAVKGAVVGGMSAGAIGSVLAGSLAAASSLIASSSVGLLTVGTSPNVEGSQASYDCWKTVVRDTSEEPSSGVALRDLVRHRNIAEATVTSDVFAPRIVLTNVWGEQFELQYVVMTDNDQLSCHASAV